jgi:hypothetical protein
MKNLYFIEDRAQEGFYDGNIPSGKKIAVNLAD